MICEPRIVAASQEKSFHVPTLVDWIHNRLMRMETQEGNENWGTSRQAQSSSQKRPELVRLSPRQLWIFDFQNVKNFSFCFFFCYHRTFYQTIIKCLSSSSVRENKMAYELRHQQKAIKDAIQPSRTAFSISLIFLFDVRQQAKLVRNRG
jgi:hypothetical protein